MFSLFSNKKKQKNVGYSNEVGAFKEKPRVDYLLPWRNISYRSGVVYGKNNDMLAVFEFRGPDLESSTDEELAQFNLSLNQAIKALPTGFVLYFDAQRHYASSYEKSEFPNPLLQEMENERADYYNSQAHFETSYYFVVYYEPPQLLKSKITQGFISSKKKSDEDTTQKIFEDTSRFFIDRVNLIGNALSHIFPDIRALSADETLTYLHSTVSTRRFDLKVNPLREFICDYIFDEPGITAGREPMIGNKHMRVVTVLNFPPVTTAGILEFFNRLDIEYRWVSRYICMSKLDADKELKNYQTLWGQQMVKPTEWFLSAIGKAPENSNPDEQAVMNRDDATLALQELASDTASYGYYTMTVTLFDEDKDAVNKKANKVLDLLNSNGFTGLIETDNSMEAWWGSIPGCYRANVRRPIISSLNFCHLAPAMATWPGDKKNEHLKGPVLLYTDTGGFTPFRLSLHCGDVGHTMICGPSGSGKSVLLNTLEAHFLKYKDAKVFIFDKAASSRALTLAIGGNFYNLAAEGKHELSFQPLARIDSDNEIKWAKEWILSYLRQQNMSVTPVHDRFVWKALQSLAEFPEEQRTISNLVDLVQDNDIRVALEPLTLKGSYGALFDNDEERSGANGRWQVYEMETLMSTPAIVPATLDYLFHRIEGSLKEAAGPSVIVLDECWLFFDNPAFKDKLREYFKDMRKKNTSIIFATQNLADVASKADLMTTVMENCPNRIFLPNVNAVNEKNKELYASFGCNYQQVKLIAQMQAKRDYYYASPKGNRIFQLALQPIELPFVTATAKSDQLAMDQILARYPREEFVGHWLKYKDYSGNYFDFNQ